jgi:hypothetical protein
MILLLATACGGGSPGPGGTTPRNAALTPDGAVRQFMQAVADSNIARMGAFWGTAHGPASVVKEPSDYERRLEVTRAFLQGSPYKITRMDPVQDDPGRMTVAVELERHDGDGTVCLRTVPYTVVKTDKYGWIVSAIDLNLAGTPGRSCAGPRPPTKP